MAARNGCPIAENGYNSFNIYFIFVIFVMGVQFDKIKFS